MEKTTAGNARYPVDEEELVGNAKFENVEMGTYLVIMENGYMVYMPTVVNLVPIYNNEKKEWELKDQNIVVKATKVAMKIVAETVIRKTAGRVPVYVHVGGWNLKDTVELAKHAVEAGADGIAVVTPSFFKISENGLVDFFVSVAKNVPEDFPVYLYAIPQYAMNDISVAAAEKAAAQCPNIIGIKYSYPDMTRIQQMMRISDGTFSVLAGPDQLLTAVVSMGGDGVVSGSSQVIPEYYEAVWEALEKNDYKLAAERQQLTNRLNEALCSVNNIAAYKAVLAYQGIIKTKKTRKPLEEYTEQQTRELFRVLKEIVKEK